ncbi:MAG: glycosyltransferase [Candidatus Eiseniibacteriota bacterium]
MRIAVLGNAAVLHTRRWADALCAHGHEARVFSLEAPPPDAAPRVGGAPITVLPALPLPRAFRYPLARGATLRALHAFEPDLVEAHYVPNYGFLATLVGRHPLAIHAWGSDLLVSAPRSWLHARRARAALARADAVFADARVLAEAAVAYGARPERVHVVPWGADLARFPLRPFVQAPRVVSVRHLEPVYDVATLIEAVPSIAASVPEARFDVAGEGPDRPALEARAQALGVQGIVRFHGRVAHETLPELLGGAAVYVSTSLSDSTSISLLEAMASGAFPVVSDLPGNREWIVSGENGLLFARGDARALADRVTDALAGPSLREAARARNRKIVEERGDFAQAVTQVTDLYAALVRGGVGARACA